jgi:putative transposon-encoded protein
VANQKKLNNNNGKESPEAGQGSVKFEVYGEEMVEKEVKMSGNSGRVYLPPDWVGHKIKIIRID